MMPLTKNLSYRNGDRSDAHPRWTSAETIGQESRLAPADPGEARILQAALQILAQGELLLGALSGAAYTEKVPLAFNGSIGGHYRHCLDHFTSLMRGLAGDEINYDHRERDRRIESDPEFALMLTREMRRRLEMLAPDALRFPVSARCEVSYAHGHAPRTLSTVGRELVYVIAHAIHHFALISVMARLMNVPLPEHFGVAPSTVAHQAKAQAH
jgi:uncharacterized damage-inducible protein DinB